MPLSHCAAQVRELDNDRFLCSLFAPAAAREGLWALYAFNLEVARIRESVREPLLGHMRLRWWHDALEAIYAGGSVPVHPVAASLADAIGRFALARAPFERLLEARARDLDDAAPASLATLTDYAEATSGSLSLLSLGVLGVDGEAACSAAREVGIAWALVGLVRAVPFHARQRRLYLPADLNRAAGLDALRLFERGAQPELPKVVAALAAAAGGHLRQARARRRELPAEALPALLPAALAHSYLRRLAGAGFDPFDTRVQKTGVGRLATVLLHRLGGRF